MGLVPVKIKQNRQDGKELFSILWFGEMMFVGMGLN
jgi:hypothetical protein